jgi:FkbM family methyltransferase
MHRGFGQRDWAVSEVEVAGRYRFGIVYGQEAGPDTDPIALAYSAGSLAHLDTLIQVALATLAPGDRALDLGAHLGGFALTAAALGCEVLAVEASPRNAGLLRLSAAHNGFQKLHVIHAAVCDERGSAEFCSHGPWGHMATPATGWPGVTVPAVRADDLLEQQGWDTVRLVKLDVEGSEVRAVRGMRRLLQRSDAPVVIFESNQAMLGLYGQTDQDLKSELRRLGYALYEVRPGSLLRVGEGHEQSAPVLDYLAAKRLPPRLAAWGPTAATPLLSRFRRWLGLTRRSA